MMLEHEYDTMRGVEDTHWWHRPLRRRVLEDLKEALRSKEPPPILDAGCGTDGKLAVLKENAEPGWQLHGIDLAAKAVAYCHDRGLKDMIEGDVPRLPGSHEFSFDKGEPMRYADLSKIEVSLGDINLCNRPKTVDRSPRILR